MNSKACRQEDKYLFWTGYHLKLKFRAKQGLLCSEVLTAAVHVILKQNYGAYFINKGFILPVFAPQARVDEALKGHFGGKTLVDALYRNLGKLPAQVFYEGFHMLCGIGGLAVEAFGFAHYEGFHGFALCVIGQPGENVFAVNRGKAGGNELHGVAYGYAATFGAKINCQ